MEIITHAGPHRRLWMGPQFTFKTFPAEGANTLSSSSPVLLSDCPESQTAVMDMDTDLKSLWWVYCCLTLYCIVCVHVTFKAQPSVSLHVHEKRIHADHCMGSML